VILLAAGAVMAAHAAAAPPDFRRAWTCDSRAKIDAISTTVIRTLDKAGKQLDVHVQWSVGDEEMFAASLFGMVTRDGSGDPPLREGTLLASWTSGALEGVDTSAPVVVLHAKGDKPRRADGRPRIDRSTTAFSAEIPWTRVLFLARRLDTAQLSVINGKDEVIGSSIVDLRLVQRALKTVAEGLSETRWQMARYEERCEPVTEWLTF
jgi:hypothetical protein